MSILEGDFFSFYIDTCILFTFEMYIILLTNAHSL